ncbi:MAG TPA: nucleotidyltransferase domain-containing protein [Polyangiaceae bacterium]|nr:nucleotidyltransferase domain-containing protein [Polyangiaceae bacterium]
MTAAMFPHHASTLRRTIEHFEQTPGVLGLLLGGSIAHGFCTEGSDVDVMIVVSDDEHRERLRTGDACFFSRELVTYAAGYVDGKYISQGFVRAVAERGSEPARFAFKDAQLLFCRDASLPPLIERAARYPSEGKAARIARFEAQVEAWRWYCSQAHERGDLPLLRTAISKLTLFAGRIVLAHNELLYPFHKWFLRVLAGAPEQPAGLLPLLEALANTPTPEAVEELARSLREFRGWSMGHPHWPGQFLRDSELNWFDGAPPIDDL